MKQSLVLVSLALLTACQLTAPPLPPPSEPPVEIVPEQPPALELTEPEPEDILAVVAGLTPARMAAAAVAIY